MQLLKTTLVIFSSKSRLAWFERPDYSKLYPTVLFNSRTSVHDTVLPRGGGPDESAPVFIPKGTPIAHSSYSLHRLPEYWGPNAEEFRPERWADNRPNSHSWDFLTFNGDPRIYISQQFTLTEASYIIVRILQTFESITAPMGHLSKESSMVANMSLSVAGGVLVHLVPDSK